MVAQRGRESGERVVGAGLTDRVELGVVAGGVQVGERRGDCLGQVRIGRRVGGEPRRGGLLLGRGVSSRGSSAQRAPHQCKPGGQRDQRRGPDQPAQAAARRVEQDPVAVAGDEVAAHLPGGGAGGELLFDLSAHSDGDGARRVGDRQPLAGGAAQGAFDADCPVLEGNRLRRGRGPPGPHGDEQHHCDRGERGEQPAGAGWAHGASSSGTTWVSTQAVLTAPTTFSRMVPRRSTT